MSCLKNHVLCTWKQTRNCIHGWRSLLQAEPQNPHLEWKATLKGPSSISWPNFFLYCLCLVFHRMLIVLILDQEMYSVSSCMLWFWMYFVSENDGHVAVIFVDSVILFLSYFLYVSVFHRWDYATGDKASAGCGHHRTASQAVCNAVR